ncbi:MAG TPA: GGDEF domain-containing protein [Burkholderiaceae bacterium]|nr:GGDEF domain-containing protein [Burkholderiaceae bacterium]
MTDLLRHLWSTTRFGGAELNAYAAELMAAETRRGVLTMSLLGALLLGAAAACSLLHGFGAQHVRTYVALALLSVHVFACAYRTHEVGTLHALGITLLTVSGSALVLLAHHTGALGSTLLASAMLLFMMIPLVPWGLREAGLVALLIYALFSLSTLSYARRFTFASLIELQFFMLAACLVSLVLVMRTVSVRKHDMVARFELERSRRRLELLSYQDPLTGAWNRRYLTQNFDAVAERNRQAGDEGWFAVLDIDHFKRINDTYGHDYGDRMLQALCRAFHATATADELVVRLGGDEFALLLRGPAAPERVAAAIADFQRDAVQHSRRDDPIPGVSVGLARIGAGADGGLDAAYKRADEATYLAKQRGGNRAIELGADAQPAAPIEHLFALPERDARRPIGDRVGVSP